MNDYQYGEYLNEKYEGNKSRLIKVLCISTIGAISAYTFVIVASNQVNKNATITWDDIKKSYVALVEEDGVYVKSLLKIKGNGIYENLLYDNVYFGNEILEYHEAVPYFVQTENVKSSYTKNELENIIEEFKIGSNEYIYSDDYVLMK